MREHVWPKRRISWGGISYHLVYSVSLLCGEANERAPSTQRGLVLRTVQRIKVSFREVGGNVVKWGNVEFFK